MNKFVIKLFSYISGELQIVEKEFERIEDAIEHGIKAAVHAYKIFDHTGCLCHDSQGDHGCGPYG